jgi:hypothetical protein
MNDVVKHYAISYASHIWTTVILKVFNPLNVFWDLISIEV